MCEYRLRRILSFLSLSIRALVGFALLAAFSATALADSAIHGSAQNLSRGRPAVGDEVMLIRINVHNGILHDRVLDPATDEETEARTKTDAQGAFTFHTRYPDKSYLVRTIHQGVAYDQPASSGDSVSIQVFDSAPRAPAISGSIEILRVGTRAAGNEKFLHVSDMYEIRNDSNPPLTQAGAHTFDVFLPADARIDSVLAAAPSAAESSGRSAGQNGGQGQSQGRNQERIGVIVSAAPVPGESGHYTVNFPLRPGATKFAFNYDLPYHGHAAFRSRHEYALQQMAIMFPPAMKFVSPSSAFQKLATGNNEYQVEAAVRLGPGDGPEFEISGNGPLPSLQTKAQTQPQSAVPANSNPTAPPAQAAPVNSAPKPDRGPARWPWLAVTSAILLSCAFLVLKVSKALRARNALPGPAREIAPRVHGQTEVSAGLLESLKEEMFQLESDRIRGSISSGEYASARQALDEIFKRAVARESRDEKAPAIASSTPSPGVVPQPASQAR